LKDEPRLQLNVGVSISVDATTPKIRIPAAIIDAKIFDILL
jgi:hypothetical protein